MTRLLTALLPLLLAYTTFVIGNEWERVQPGAPEVADCVAAQHGRVPVGELGAVGGGFGRCCCPWERCGACSSLRPGRGRGGDSGGVAGAAGVSMALLYTGSNRYEYLTDFTLTLRRASGWSHYDVNGMLFVVAWPVRTWRNRQ